MGTEVIGEFLHDSSSTYYFDWFPRQGDGAYFACDVVGISGANCSVTVSVYTKDEQDMDSQKVFLGSVTGSGAVELIGVQLTGCEELVRYEISVADVGIPIKHQEWAILRMLPPGWFNN